MEVKLAKTNVRKQVGSDILSSLLPLARTLAPSIGKTLGLSALAGLASKTVSQIVKSISGGGIPYFVSYDNLQQLAKNAHLLTKIKSIILLRLIKLVAVFISQQQIHRKEDFLVHSLEAMNCLWYLIWLRK